MLCYTSQQTNTTNSTSSYPTHHEGERDDGGSGEFEDDPEDFPTDGEEIPTVFGMEQLCLFLNISSRMCSCNTHPELCPFQAFEEQHENKTSKEYERSHARTMVYTIVTLMASVFGVIGNIAVLLVAYKQRRSLTSCKLHIAENALVNLIFSLTSIVNVTHLLIANSWPLSLGACKFMRTLIEMCGLLTVGIILIIAVERYFLIVYSIQVEGIFKHVGVGVSVVFVVASVVPYTIGIGIEEHSERCVEFRQPFHNLALPYYWFVVISLNFIPFCVISFLYGTIVVYISNQAAGIDQGCNRKLYMKKMKANRRVMLVTLCILVVFLVTTLPTRIIRIYFTMRHSHEDGSGDFWMDDMDLHLNLVLVSYLTYPFQSNLNPLMYSMLDTEWRKELRIILKHFQTFMIRVY